MCKQVDQLDIQPVGDTELPPEFKKIDRPFGLMEQRTWNFYYMGLLSHSCGFYALFYLIPFGHISLWTFPLAVVIGYMGGLGITVGCHRYWTHRTFKATKPLQYLLMLMQTLAMQYPIFKWCKDHRAHHKYTDTDADPHSSARGFWFSHINWLFLPKHPKVIESLNTIDISDLARDPVVRFQSKYYWELCFIVFLVIPMWIGHVLFPETTLFHLFCWNAARYVASLHVTFLVNSVNHRWGDKPYDQHISATENKFVAMFAVGEGWHNYHHCFPWDYKAAEFGFKYNFSTVFIHFCAMIGWAYDLKTVSHKLLVDRINRTGDGTHALHRDRSEDSGKTYEHSNHLSSSTSCWGWGDKQLCKADVEVTETIFPSTSRHG